MSAQKGLANSASSKLDSANVKVGTTVHLTRETLELLRDVALARHISDIGSINKQKHVKLRTQPNISDVISDIIERSRTLLEQERDRTLGRKRG